MDAISEISRDKQILTTKGTAAAAMMEMKTWDISTAALIARLDQKYIEKNTSSLH